MKADPTRVVSAIQAKEDLKVAQGNYLIFDQNENIVVLSEQQFQTMFKVVNGPEPRVLK